MRSLPSVVSIPAMAGAILFIVEIVAGPSAVAQDREIAALAPNVPAALCSAITDIPSARRILACTTAIESGGLKGRDLAQAYLKRAEAYGAAGQSPKAAPDYREAIRLLDGVIAGSKSDAHALFERGTARYALDDAERALVDYDESIRLGPDNPLPLVKRGILLATRKAETRRAIADFDRALVLSPNDVDILILRGDAYALLGEYGRSLGDLDRAIELAPHNARARVVHGLAQARLGNFQSAYADYTAALAIDDRNVDALVNRAAIVALTGDGAAAIRDLDAALALQPGNPLAYFNRGYARFAAKDYDRAIADYEAALALDPRMAWAYLNRCLTRSIAGKDPAGALADCDEALKLLPGDPRVRETRGFVYLKLGDVQRALQEYDAATLTDRNRPLALYGRGLARVRNSDAAGGEADKRAARALFADVAREFSPYGLE